MFSGIVFKNVVNKKSNDFFIYKLFRDSVDYWRLF